MSSRGPGPMQPKAGFTIVEIILAMAILLIGMTSVLGLLSFGAGMARNAQLRSASAASVEAVLADLEEALFPLVREGSTQRLVAGPPHQISNRGVRGHPGLFYDARATLAARTPPDASEKPSTGPTPPEVYAVEIDMHWETSGQARSKTFRALFPRRVPFGERLRRELVQGDLDPMASIAPDSKLSKTQP